MVDDTPHAAAPGSCAVGGSAGSGRSAGSAAVGGGCSRSRALCTCSSDELIKAISASIVRAQFSDDKREGMDFLGRPKFGIIPQKKSKF